MPFITYRPRKLKATSRRAYCRGVWAMMPSYAGPAKNEHVNIELGKDDNFQLYNPAQDLAKQTNLAATQPDKLKDMLAAFERISG